MNVKNIDNKKCALITGAASGLGKSLAKNLIAQGWFVIGIDIDKDNLQKCSEKWNNQFYPITCNVNNPIAIKQTTSKLLSQNMLPSLFIFSAGVGSIEQYGTVNTEEHHHTFAVNYFGIITWIELWLALCLQYGGTFVSISSILAKHSTPGSSAYCASKAAIASAFQSLRMNYANTKVKFITVFPGPMKTAMLKTEKHVPFVKTPDSIAPSLLRKIFRGKATITIPLSYHLIFRLINLLPERISEYILKK